MTAGGKFVVMGYHVVVDLLQLSIVFSEELERFGYRGHRGGGGTDLCPQTQQALEEVFWVRFFGLGER